MNTQHTPGLCSHGFIDPLSLPDLLAAASDALESLRRLPNAPDAYRVTCIAQLSSAIAKATRGHAENDPTVTYTGFGDDSHSPYCECYQCVEVEE